MALALKSADCMKESLNMKRLITVFAVSLVTTLICTGAYASSKKENPSPTQHSQPSIKNSGEEAVISGKVVETMNAGGYTYVCIEKKGVKTWVAVPQTDVKVGQQMAFQPGAEMKNFTSKTLNRTFDSIIFSAGPVASSGAGSKKASAKHEGGMASAIKTAEKISVEKATGPNAYTVGEVYAKKASLNKKSVVIHGKVVKVSLGIMGKNWVHVQDGTGDAGTGTHNLVVTTQDSPSVGDVVTVKGTLYKDKDFGAGYKYDVIVEQASVQR